MLPGRALARLTDLGWGGTLRTLLEGPAAQDDAPASSALLAACVRVLGEWDWAERPVAVVSMPSRRHPLLIESVARGFAEAGRLRLPGLARARERGPRRRARRQQRLAAVERVGAILRALRAAGWPGAARRRPRGQQVDAHRRGSRVAGCRRRRGVAVRTRAARLRALICREAPPWCPRSTVASCSSERTMRESRPPPATTCCAASACRSLVSKNTCPPGASHCDASAETRLSTASPSSPPSRVTRGSWLRASGGSSAIASLGTYGTLASSMSTRPRRERGSGSKRSPS